MKRCQFCQAENVDDAAFCDLCGASLGTLLASAVALPLPPSVPAPPPVALSAGPSESQASQKAKCAVCGATCAPGQQICDNCGAHLGPISPDAGLASSPAVPSAAPDAVLPPPDWPEPLASAPVTLPDSPLAKAGTLPMLTARSAAPPPGHPRLMIASNGMYFDLFGRTDVTIGRVDPVSGIFPEIDLTIHGGDESGVSRRHCRITLAGNQYFAEDLGSTNGTWIGATHLQAGVRTAINNGDQLRLGKLVLGFFAGC